MEFYSNDYNTGTISSTGIGWSDRAAVVGEESFGVTIEVMAQERRRLEVLVPVGVTIDHIPGVIRKLLGNKLIIHIDLQRASALL